MKQLRTYIQDWNLSAERLRLFTFKGYLLYSGIGDLVPELYLNYLVFKYRRKGMFTPYTFVIGEEV
jgi:hypothetical protein